MSSSPIAPLSRRIHAGVQSVRRQLDPGYSLLDLLFVVSLMATMSGVTTAMVVSGLDEQRTAGAARYLVSRLQEARMLAVTRSTVVAIQFSQTGSTFMFRTFVDGNNNGVLSKDIANGTDRPAGGAERLPDNFAGADFGVLPNLPAVDPGGTPPGSDPIRLGVSNIASFAPAGTSSSGSLYIRGRGATQYVVRLYGDTGKTRILKFNPLTKEWKPV